MNRGAENDTAPALAATMIRDTVLMPEGTSVVLRYVVDSPGVWCGGGGRGARWGGALAVGRAPPQPLARPHLPPSLPHPL